MMSKVTPRDVSPLIQKFRNFLLGRELVSTLRFEGKNIAARTQPPPSIPGGPNHKISHNYYYARDCRGEMAQPQLISGGQNSGLLTSEVSESSEKALVSTKKPKTPGKVNLWDM
ncbi:NADH dehydrogenase [ubiquinone] 1 alpha subcomplex subunit 7-like [Artemia franciscana]|uniref:NADH dehydrogenase [ubiquinone] 1 alpha subcomplex subunit 7 n=1 Tax=Artemia franciscana TaxID=6661 RepID=A0AA88L5M2_ARTSF|nr:hypothetical protein QYM36_009516 [Artemia franciscana]